MDFEDSRNAIFCDPNAFVKSAEQKQIKKVVFAEPYDCLPSFYIDHDFKKQNCDCIPKPCPPKPPKSNCSPFKPFFGFDFKSLMPILMGLLNKGGSGDMGKLLSNLTNLPSAGQQSDLGGGFDLQGILAQIAKNPKMLESVMSLFKGGGLNLFGKKKKQQESKPTKQTDHVIKNYTRVEV